MKSLFFFATTCMLCFVSNGQSVEKAIRRTKGKWIFPIHDIQTIDTTYDLTMKSACSQQVKALQAGIVRSVTNVEGSCYLVIIQTGDYFLGYVGLSNPQIKKGDEIKEGEPIGNLEKGVDGETYDLTLIFMRKTKRLNINCWFDWKRAFQANHIDL